MFSFNKLCCAGYKWFINAPETVQFILSLSELGAKIMPVSF